MMLLVDTNVWLERLLNQEKSSQVCKFLNKIPAKDLFISDFSLHSIGVIMDNLNLKNEYWMFVYDLFGNAKINYATLKPLELESLTRIIKIAKLDFDDAYQVAISEKYGLEIVTFDKDFKKTNIITLNPMEAMEKFNSV
jgi:uncharacterized protein